MRDANSGSVIFIPHGGGPLPLLGHRGHDVLVDFLQHMTPSLGQPSAILVISAHWEEAEVTITSGTAPPLIYDYYGFPDAAYKIKYPAPGEPELARRIHGLLQQSGIKAKLDDSRGFDHGMFVPLSIMYPQASIPCVQISLLNSLDAESHINIGRALSALRQENLLVIGSGFSFHNMDAMKSQTPASMASQNSAFEDWLIETCSGEDVSLVEREKRLIHWLDAPFARYCHPREEHLLPLHVCFGLAQDTARLIFESQVVGVKVSGYRW